MKTNIKQIWIVSVMLGCLSLSHGAVGAALDSLRDVRARALAGDLIAQYELGRRHELGIGLPQSDVRAVDWYRQAAQAGLARAQYQLGRKYASGEGLLRGPRDRRRMTASATSADARRERGKMPAAASDQVSNEADAPGPPPRFVAYSAVPSVSQDYRMAAYWFRKAAAQNDSLAQNRLGRLYEQGLGVSQDLAEAYKWYALATRGTRMAQPEANRIRLLKQLTPVELAEAELAITNPAEHPLVGQR